MKKFRLTLTEQGDLRAFEVRAYIELEADTLLDLLLQLPIEMARVYELKIEDAIIRERLHREHDRLEF